MIVRAMTSAALSSTSECEDEEVGLITFGGEWTRTSTWTFGRLCEGREKESDSSVRCLLFDCFLL